jgi:hypothetical protein
MAGNHAGLALQRGSLLPKYANDDGDDENAEQSANEQGKFGILLLNRINTLRPRDMSRGQRFFIKKSGRVSCGHARPPSLMMVDQFHSLLASLVNVGGAASLSAAIPPNRPA